MRLRRFLSRASLVALCLVSILLLAWGVGGPVSGRAGQKAERQAGRRAGLAQFRRHIREIYADTGLDGSLEYHVFEAAMIGYYNLVRSEFVPRDRIITIIDYTRPSAEERFFVLDLETRRMLHKSLVAHGMNSGEDCAESFSNEPGSHQTSLGFYVTGGDYLGAHGKAMRLAGVDSTFNDRAEERYIVVHGAWYCTYDFVEEYGRLGRSWGCPVLPPDVAPQIIDTIKGGTCLFAYYSDDEYLKSSSLLDVDAAVEEFLRRERAAR